MTGYAKLPNSVFTKYYLIKFLDVIRRRIQADIFKQEGFDIGTSKAWLHSRCLTKADAIVVSDCLDEKTLSDMLVQKAKNLDHAIEMALRKQGKDARILVLMNAADMIPTCN